MTTYYVSKAEGNDSNDGKAPTDEGGGVGPKLTITGAEAMGLSGDDIIYIGPGLYRETVQLTDSGTDGHPIKWIADPECEHLTGDTPGVDDGDLCRQGAPEHCFEEPGFQCYKIYTSKGIGGDTGLAGSR